MAPLLKLSLLALPALLPAVTAQNASSPSVYPTPQGDGTGSWADAYTKAKALVSKMTLAEMNNLTSGISNGQTGCSGESGSVPRLGFPGLCLSDAGNGLRNVDGVNAYASGISIGASWNNTLAYQRGNIMGAEFKTKGSNMILGPVVGPLGRIARGGRNWEGMSNDPYLAGILGAVTVKGLQENVIACVKHYIGNEQETHRTSTRTLPASSSNIDDGTMHELYLWPFQDLVEAGAGSIMCSYNKINGTYGCENSKTLNGLLKDELNFQGFVVTDWGAEHSGLPEARAGLDMVMPNSAYWVNGSLVAAINNGSLAQSRLEDMATRIVASWYLLGQDSPDYPKLGVGIPKSLTAPHEFINAKDPAAIPEILEEAIEGHVLVKNVNNALPLKKPEVLSVFGYDATARNNYVPQLFGATGNSSGSDFFSLNYQDVGAPDNVFSIFLAGPAYPDAPQTQDGFLFTGGGSGASQPAYMSAPYDAIAAQARLDGTALFHDFNQSNPSVPSSTSACLVFVNEFASEGFDRPGLAHLGSDQLIINVANKCANTIAVIHNAGVRLVDRFVDHPNVTAIVYAHLPGQDAGYAIADLLYGKAGFSGRLPYTVAKNESDYGALANPCDTKTLNCNFTEGEEIDYRAFLARNVTPRYEFGFGLTYSNFSYSNLQIQVSPQVASNTTGKSQGGSASLFEQVGTITATITNTGVVPAAEVAQLYISIPGAPTKQLRGFDKLFIGQNASAVATFPLRRKDVSRWDVTSQKWIVPQGSFQVEVGASVLDARLTGSF